LGKEVFGYWFLVFGFNQELKTKNLLFDCGLKIEYWKLNIEYC